jgi:hypothetical protein
VTESVAYVAASSEERTLIVDWIGFYIVVIAYGWFLFLAVLKLQQCCVCVLDLVCILRRTNSFNISTLFCILTSSATSRNHFAISVYSFVSFSLF